LDIVERVIGLLVIPLIHLGTGFLGGTPQGTEGRKLIACLDEGFDAHVDDICEDISAPRRLEHCTDQDATATVAEGGDLEVCANEREMPPAIAADFVLLEAALDVRGPHRSGDMIDEARREGVKDREVPQALKGLEQDGQPQSGHRRFRGVADKRQIISSRGVELPQVFIGQIGTDPWIGCLVNRRHRRARKAERAKSVLCAQRLFED
jgi:hypothetical protein